MKKLNLLILLLSIVVLTGCESSQLEAFDDELIRSRDFVENNNYKTEYINLSNQVIPQGKINTVSNISDSVVGANDIYFAVNNEVVGDVTVESSDIYRFNTLSSRVDKIYSVEGEEGFQVQYSQ